MKGTKVAKAYDFAILKCFCNHVFEGDDLAFPGKRMTRAGHVRSTEPLIFQPVPLPEPLEKSFHNWDEYWDWSPQVR